MYHAKLFRKKMISYDMYICNNLENKMDTSNTCIQNVYTFDLVASK